MKKKIIFVSFLALGAAALAFYFLGFPGNARPKVAAQGAGSEIVLYTGENFTGRVIRVIGTLYDLPKDEEPDGSLYDWNDQVRSIVVLGGTWRLYQHGRSNTRLDDTAIEEFDIQEKLPAKGWSTLVSATSQGPLEIPELDRAGIGPDISSAELISAANLPDWALSLRSP